ncbi:nucleoside deaminase [candidate division KSB3 bacterium]|uniref:Nucleoside deaminase n=1 Tax=candidate division KSB3 bacterium TaxID=2044937 RepID=A0A9D5JTZ0_9BACT|nr:nucleoside deaminase [candidate division KSB3 bacterium]MBD3323636.1 nucleoside deaminase [candidate division KSB3 bacterium]
MKTAHQEERPMQHDQFIREALALAKRAAQAGNEPFGALLVHNGEIIMTAQNTQTTEHDCTRHAELNLVSYSMRRFSPAILSQSLLYTSTEPCIMCAGAIHWAGISTMVYSCSQVALEQLVGEDYHYIPSREVLERLQSQTRVVGPVLEDEGVRLLQELGV